MICSKCNRFVPDDEKTCPHCKSDMATQEKRCPQCWTKLSDKDVNCPKCGCDIKRTIAEREEIETAEPVTFFTVIKNLPLFVKILIPVIIVALIVLAVINSNNKAIEMRKNVVKYTAVYEEQLIEAVDAITVIANEYKNGVYDRDWNLQAENAQELRRVHGDEISEITALKEPIVHTANNIIQNSDEKTAALTEAVYYAYRNCYEYVVLEGGKASGYMENYLVLVEEFNTALDELLKDSERYKE